MDLIIGYVMDVARWLLVAVLTLLNPEAYSAWTGIVVEIVRPDEVKVDRMGESVNVRLYGIDSPLEIRGQAFGKVATAYAERTLIGRLVRVQPLPGYVKGPWHKPRILPYDDLHWDGNVKNRYKRIIALVHTDGISLNKEYLRRGMAWWYRPFVPFERGYKYHEDRARERREGLWQLPDPTPPWEFQHTPIARVNPWQRETGELTAIVAAGGVAVLLVVVMVYFLRRSVRRIRKGQQAKTLSQ